MQPKKKVMNWQFSVRSWTASSLNSKTSQMLLQSLHVHCVQKNNTHSPFLSYHWALCFVLNPACLCCHSIINVCIYLHEWCVDLNKNCSAGTVDSDNVEISYSFVFLALCRQGSHLGLLFVLQLYYLRQNHAVEVSLVSMKDVQGSCYWVKYRIIIWGMNTIWSSVDSKDQNHRKCDQRSESKITGKLWSNSKIKDHPKWS